MWNKKMNKQMANLSILLIEQNAGNARLIESLLQGIDNIDFEISWTSRLDDGIRLSHSKLFQACLLDLTMKEYSEYETLSTYVSNCPTLPVIAIVDVVQTKDIFRLYKIGAKDILMKNRLSSFELIRSIYAAVINSFQCKEDSKVVHAMSDQFRGILANIKASVDMLKKESFGELNDNQIGLCDMAIHNTQKMNALARDIVEYTDLTKGNVDFNKEEEDIIKTIKETLSVTRMQADKKGLRIYFDEVVPKAIMPYDRDKMVVLLMHLLNNCITFTDHGDIVTTCYIKDKEVIIEIKDTGIGISQHDLPSIFKPFPLIQLDDQYKRRQGNGLGLAIAKQLARLHGGNLQISSELGVGTTFTLSFPYKGV
jgi:signal transduction histidine kinase